MLVDDGSVDSTWSIITGLHEKNKLFCGIRQSRNRGHQNAVLAGLMEAYQHCDITITIDCDGQDDINAIESMVDKYMDGAEVVYGVRNSRDTDTWFKRNTAQLYYRILKWLGADVIYNHADYRLLSSVVVKELAEYHEVNLFLRGLVPLVGFDSDYVYYERNERLAGESHYPFTKMLSLAINGVTSLSVRPLRIVQGLGLFISVVSFIGVIWAIVVALLGKTTNGWASMICIICLLGGVQLTCIGILGEYIGKIYLEVKRRPRYIISERICDFDGRGIETNDTE